MRARKGCTPTSPEADTELPMVPVGEGSQPYLQDENSVGTSFSHRECLSLNLHVYAGNKKAHSLSA